MATFTAINCKHQSGGAMRGTLDYVSQKRKTLWGDAQLVVGHNCVPQSAYTEMLTTKQQFRKTDGRQFYHFVQSFAKDDPVTPAEANAIGLELAQREFPGFEVVIATHVDTSHIHNHLVVNSVSCVDGKKLHQSADDLLAHRKANDEICLAHGLNILERPEKQSRMKRMKPGEYQAGLYADSWKLDLIQTINDVLEYAGNPDEFVEGMEREGYQVIWTKNRKHITFLCPNGRRCRDSSLHDETFLKENMEALFVYRQMIGFQGEYSEPEIGWIGEASQGLLQLGKQLEQNADQPQLPEPPVWTDSKLRRREALIKMAHGQKLSHDIQRCLDAIGGSCSTFVKNYNIIHGSLEKAVELGMIIRNPCKGVTFPEDDKQDMRVLSKEEQQRFIAALDGEYYRPMLLTYLYAGLRMGEGIPLTWQDIDLERRTIRVNKKAIVCHDYNNHEARQVIQDFCKTKSSKRKVVITAGLAEVLKAHRENMIKRAEKIGKTWSESDLVFPNTNGNIVYSRNLQHTLYRIFAKAGIEGATMHTLRHSYATRCFEAGVDIKAISEQLGHANVKTTYNIYVHLLEDTKEKEIDKLDGIDKLLA